MRTTRTKRIPAWSRDTLLKLNGEKTEPDISAGYVYFDVNGGLEVELTLDGSPVFVRPSNKIPAIAGMTAVKRGPLVYCFEGVDNGRGGPILHLGEPRRKRDEGLDAVRICRLLCVYCGDEEKR